MLNHQATIRSVIEETLSPIVAGEKIGEKILKGSVADALTDAGFDTDQEDSSGFLQSGMPVWRTKETHLIEETKHRRLIDIVVYRDAQLAALIETESDLRDLREEGITRRSGHYDVYSIAGSGQGQYFDSYKSLERMAAAAHFAYLMQKEGAYPGRDHAVSKLELIQSNSPASHNPLQVPMFLVSGECRPKDHTILAGRLNSLDAELICVS